MFKNCSIKSLFLLTQKPKNYNANHRKTNQAVQNRNSRKIRNGKKRIYTPNRYQYRVSAGVEIPKSKHVKEQLAVLNKLNDNGYKSVMAGGFDNVKQTIDNYLN